MTNIYLIIGSVIGFLLVLIGSIVIIKNRHLKLHRVFFGVTVSSAAWIVANYLSNDQSLSISYLRATNHLVLFFAGLFIIFIVKFVAIITRSNFIAKYGKLLNTVSYVSILLTLTPLVVADISQQGSVYAIHFGVLAPFYFLMLLLNIVVGLAMLISGIKKSEGSDRLRLTTILWSLGITIAVNVVTNAIIPYLTGSFSLTNLGPITSIILIAGLSYSIVKHHLFDIRLIIVRALGYVLSILTLGLIYAAITLLLVNQFIFSDTSFDKGQTAVFMAIAIFLTLTFPAIKQFFDWITRKVFYQDSYEPEVFLNAFNQTVTSTIQLDDLLKASSNTIQQHLKAGYCSFSINETQTSTYRLIGSKIQKSKPHDLQRLDMLMSQQREDVIVTDLLEYEEQSELKKYLLTRDIALIARLSTSTFVQKGAVGYLLLGLKQSGNSYNNQDKKITQIIAKELTIAIQNALQFEEIEQFNITLQERIREATKELRQKNRKLHELDKAKDEFISIASHQLRTPLTTVKGYLSMLLEGDTGKVSRQQKRLLNLAYDSSQSMVNLITDMLNVSRISTGKFVIDSTPIDLPSLVKKEVELLENTAKSRQVELVTKLPATCPTVWLDESKTRQVIMNFIDNAIYYTPPGGTVTVELAVDSEMVEFRVSDTGIGVSELAKQNLFTKFFRADNAKSQRPDGTGLGLFMAKKVITAQAGSIIFTSRLGHGSTFGFRFALRAIGAGKQSASTPTPRKRPRS